MSYRLVESVRVGNKVNRNVLLNLGGSFDIAKEDWKELVSIISDRLSGTGRLFEGSAQLESKADEIVARLRERQADSKEVFDRVDLSSLRHECCQSVGNERLAMQAMSLLELDGLFKHLGVGKRLSKLMQAQIASRMIHPSSERENARWLREESALGELLGLDVLHFTDKRLHRAADKLYGFKDAIEAHVHQEEKSLFGLSSTIIFYDLTNTWFYGTPSHELAGFGRNKQKRHDCLQVSLGLCLNEAGFPVRSEILPGAVSEPKSLQGALKRLDKVTDNDNSHVANKPLVVMDAGMCSDANINWLNEQGYGWIVVDRRKEAVPEREADSCFQTKYESEIKVWRLGSGSEKVTKGVHAKDTLEDDPIKGQSNEIRLCVHSEAKATTEEKILNSARNRFEVALSALNEGLSKKGRLKNYDKVQRKIGRLIQQYAGVGAQYDIKVNACNTHPKNARSIVYKRNKNAIEKDQKKGAYLLRTSQSEWSDEMCVRTYWLLNEVEQTFRSLKSELGLRPIHHQTASRVGAHLFISVLAYHGVHMLRTRLKKAGIKHRWEGVRQRMSTMMRIQTSLKNDKDKLYIIKQDSEPNTMQKRILHAIGIHINREQMIKISPSNKSRT